VAIFGVSAGSDSLKGVPAARAERRLIHIGDPKSVSNALRRWFGAHLQLAFVDGGLAGFRDGGFRHAVHASDYLPDDSNGG